MKNSFFITALILLISFTTTAQKNAVPYLDKDRHECVLAYNSVTGVSRDTITIPLIRYLKN